MSPVWLALGPRAHPPAQRSGRGDEGSGTTPAVHPVSQGGIMSLWAEVILYFIVLVVAIEVTGTLRGPMDRRSKRDTDRREQ